MGALKSNKQSQKPTSNGNRNPKLRNKDNRIKLNENDIEKRGIIMDSKNMTKQKIKVKIRANEQLELILLLHVSEESKQNNNNN